MTAKRSSGRPLKRVTAPVALPVALLLAVGGSCGVNTGYVGDAPALEESSSPETTFSSTGVDTNSSTETTTATQESADDSFDESSATEGPDEPAPFFPGPGCEALSLPDLAIVGLQTATLTPDENSVQVLRLDARSEVGQFWWEWSAAIPLGDQAPEVGTYEVEFEGFVANGSEAEGTGGSYEGATAQIEISEVDDGCVAGRIYDVVSDDFELEPDAGAFLAERVEFGG